MEYKSLNTATGDAEAEVSKKFDENLKFFGGAGRKSLFAALRADFEDRRFAAGRPRRRTVLEQC